MDATERLAHWRRWHGYVLDRKGCRTDDNVLDAIAFASGDDVTRLHKRFQVLTAADPNYRLRSDDVVSNRWHGSMHTKLANRDAGLEIEFLSYEVDWSD